MPTRRPNIALIFAALVIAAAILLTAYHGNIDWMALLLFLALLLPGWKRIFTRWLERNSNDRCEPPPAP
jgi:hypothetical protein